MIRRYKRRRILLVLSSGDDILIPLKIWLEKYLEISEIMGYDIARDREATRMLAHILKAKQMKPPLNKLRDLFYGKNVLIFGAGPSLDDALDSLLWKVPDFHRKATLVAADGATQALIERNMIPQVIVTDLDGDMKSILYSALRGSVIVVHAHGDNIDKLSRYVEEITSVTDLIIGTTQVEPVEPLQNFGGFTDGDRAVFIASSYGAEKIILVGMDFGRIVGRHSKPWLRHDVVAWSDKLKKLEIAYNLISWIAAMSDLKIYTLSGNAPQNVKRIRPDDLDSVLRCNL